MNNNKEAKIFRKRRVFKDLFDVVVVFVFERPTNCLGHIKTGPRLHPTDRHPFGIKIYLSPVSCMLP